LRDFCIKDEILCLREIHRPFIYGNLCSRYMHEKCIMHTSAASYHQHMGVMISNTQNPKRLCKLIFIRFLRHILRKHDYKILMYHARHGVDIYPDYRCLNVGYGSVGDDLECTGIHTNNVGGRFVDKFTHDEL
jgi:hypothetical protein